MKTIQIRSFLVAALAFLAFAGSAAAQDKSPALLNALDVRQAQAFIETSTRRVAANSAADHCKRLAELNTQSATTVRELAAQHQKLATGAPSTPPRDSARQAAVHCDRLVALSRDSAKEATEVAAMHKSLAGVAR